MARVAYSALISSASGKIGDIVASNWKGVPYLRRRVIPANPQSGKQCRQRYELTMALTLWQSIKAWAKAPWTLAASGYALSGYNKFMDMCMATLKPQFTYAGTGQPPTLTSPAVTVGTPYNDSYPALIDPSAVTPGAGTLTQTWTKREGAGANNMVRVLYRLDNATAWDAAESVLESAQTVTVQSLTGGKQYELALVPYNSSTVLYGQSTHTLATPSS